MQFYKIFAQLLTVFTIVLIGSSSVFSQVTPPTVINFGPGGVQSWTVPDCVSSVTFTVAGGAGAGNAFGQTGGNGAVITFNLTVSPGDVFQMDAGGSGANPAGGTNGGGSGQTSTIAGYNSGGGGGASTVSSGGTAIAIAGGGGGAGGGDAAGSGGNGGCGVGLSIGGGFGTAGTGGTQSGGGIGGPPYAGGGGTGGNGSLGQGGAGGIDNNVSQSPGGGGGGGYYGGGGGGSDFISFSNSVGGSGGGGGSSLVPAGAGCNDGVNAGAGYVTVSFIGGLQAVAGNTGAYCVGETIQLNGSGGIDYAWTGPGGFTSTLQNPTITTSTTTANADTLLSGTYQLIVSDPNCPDTDTAFTIVTVNPVPTVDAIMDQTLCHDDLTTQVDFTGILTSGVTYNWTNDNTNTNLAATGAGTIAPFMGSALTVPEVSEVIVIPSTAFCVGLPDTFEITVLPKPLLAVSNDTTICENGTANLVATASGGGGGTYTYFWDFTTSPLGTQDVDPLVQTTYNVYAENSFGCASITEPIVVSLHPPLSGTISLVDTICPGYPTDLTSTAGGGIGTPYTFVWSTTDTYTGAGLHTINVNPPVTTDYIVTITDGCETTPLVLNTRVRVAPLPVPMVDVLNPIQCEPAIFDIVNITDPALSQYNYWLVDGKYQYLNQDTISTPAFMAGDYDVQLIVTTFEGCVDSITFTDLLTVDPKPRADFKYSPNPVLMFNTQVKFVNYSFNGYTYEWFFEEGFPSQSTQTNVDVLFPDGVEGRYDITLITTSELGCMDTMYHELVIYPEVLIYAPNTFTPDGDEHNQTWKIFMEGIDIYDFELLIFNRWGEVVWESHDIEIGWDGTYNGSPVEMGTYSWTLKTKDLLNDEKYLYEGHINLLK